MMKTVESKEIIDMFRQIVKMFRMIVQKRKMIIIHTAQVLSQVNDYSEAIGERCMCSMFFISVFGKSK